MMARGRRPARCGSGGRDGGNPWTDPPDAGYCAQEAAAESRGTMVRVLQRLLRLGGRVTGLVLLPALAWADVETVHVSLEAYGIDQGLSQSGINALVEDDLGHLWIGTQDGLNRFDGHEFRIMRRNPPAGLAS